MESIGQLAAGVAHDFNNILTVIQGHVGLMQHELPPESSQTKSLQEIDNASARAAALIRHLELNETLLNALKMLQRLVGEHVQVDATTTSNAAPQSLGFGSEQK